MTQGNHNETQSKTDPRVSVQSKTVSEQPGTKALFPVAGQSLSPVIPFVQGADGLRPCSAALDNTAACLNLSFWEDSNLPLQCLKC